MCVYVCVYCEREERVYGLTHRQVAQLSSYHPTSLYDPTLFVATVPRKALLAIVQYLLLF